MAGPHDRIIADAAKAALGPLGFRRKGRSRVWLADHAWWLIAVEFQPSAWSRGSYLNVAAHWLWSETGDITFGFGHRVAPFQEYRSDEQFAAAASGLADRAAEEARRLAGTFGSLPATADALSDGAETERERPGWRTYHAGVAAGVAGRPEAAAELFRRVCENPVYAEILHLPAGRMAELLPDPAAFRREVAGLVERQRAALKLSPLDGPPF